MAYKDNIKPVASYKAVDQRKYNATGSAAINLSTNEPGSFRLLQVMVHFNTAPTTSENIVVKIDAVEGAAYDTVLLKTDPSSLAATDVFYVPDEEVICYSGDQINVAFTNTDGRTYGARIVTEGV